MDEDRIEDLISTNVNNIMTEKQNDLLTSMEKLLERRLGCFEKRMNETQISISENQLSKLKASQNNYTFKRKSCEEQFVFNAKVEEKFMDIEDNLSTPSADTIKKAKDYVSEGKDLIKHRQKLIKMADGSELGWKIVQEYEANPLASDSEDEKKMMKAEARADRKSKKEKAKRTRFRREPYQNTQRPYLPQPPRAPLNGPSHPEMAQNRYKPGLCWSCGFPGHWKAECTAPRLTKADKISTLHVSHFRSCEQNVSDNISNLDKNTDVPNHSFDVPENHIVYQGRLLSCLSRWSEITHNDHILNVIRHGYKLPFTEVPTSVCLGNNRSSKDHPEFVSAEIQKLLETGVVSEVSEKPHVVNPLTVAHSRSGKPRLVLDCRHINPHLAKFKCKYEGVQTAEQMFEKGTYLFTFDLKGAYHHIEIFRAHRTYLGFHWVDGGITKYYVYNCLPFGISTAGYIFTKVLRVVLEYWRSQGHKVLMFLDDGMGGHTDQSLASHLSIFVRNSLLTLGFLISEEKSSWDPSLKSTWMGHVWHMQEGILTITDERVDRIETCIDSLFREIENNHLELVKVRFLASVVGQIISTQSVAGNSVQLMCRELFKCLLSRASWNSLVILSASAADELKYWRHNVRQMNARGKSISADTRGELAVFVDASSLGYGGYISFCHQELDGQHDKGTELSHEQVIEIPGPLRGIDTVQFADVGVWHFDAGEALDSGDVVLETDEFEQLHDCRFFQPRTEVLGTWSQSERAKSSTWREAEAVSRVLCGIANSIRGHKVKLFCDNRNVISLLQRGSNKPDLQTISLAVQKFCTETEVSILPTWIPRELNSEADRLSRCSDCDDWSIREWVFKFLDKSWGPHSIDRFSNNLNSKCLKFNSKWWVPGTAGVNALDQTWSNDCNWVVPPPALLALVVRKIIRDHASCTLIIPEWKSSAFWPMLVDEFGQFKAFVSAFEKLPKFNIIGKGHGRNGIFAKNPLPFHMIALKTRFVA